MVWQPKAADFLELLADQNPWRELGRVPAELAKPVQRTLGERLADVLRLDEPHRFELILGPRRVGKTTVMYQAVARLLEQGTPARRLHWLRLDHPLLMRMPLGDLVSTVARDATPDQPAFVFLDELNYADDWDRWLKTFYDERWPLRIAASSSSAAALRHRRLESGVGRWEEQYLGPWLFTEYLALRGHIAPVAPAETLAASIEEAVRAKVSLAGLAEERRRFLLVGGFPELLTLDPSRDEASEILRSQRILRADAVERAIYKDLPQVYGISEPMKLERLLYTLAGQTGGILSPTTLASDLGLSQPTVDRYVSHLERAFLVLTLPNYAKSEETVQRRGRKLYFVDGAVRNAALQRGIAPLRDRGEMGLLFENVAASHLHALSLQTGHRLYYWRKPPAEVDLVYDDPDAPLAFEIASSRRHDTKGLMALQSAFPRFRGRSWLVAPDVAPLPPSPNGDVGSLPLDLLLVASGLHTERALRRRLGVS